MFGINFNRGVMIVVDFTRNGEQHQSIRWSSDPLACPKADCAHKEALETFYKSIGAEIISIRKVEFSEICCSS